MQFPNKNTMLIFWWHEVKEMEEGGYWQTDQRGWWAIMERS